MLIVSYIENLTSDYLSFNERYFLVTSLQWISTTSIMILMMIMLKVNVLMMLLHWLESMYLLGYVLNTN